MDVLLRLIERHQLPITQVSLVAVTGQFLDYVASRQVASAALADFATTGSRLVLLKSRSLLPRLPREDDQESEDDLVKELMAYQAVRDAAKRLAALDVAGVGAFAHRPETVVAPLSVTAPPLARHQVRSLVTALRRRLSTTVATPTTVPVTPVVSLRQMAERILHQLHKRASIPFSTVVTPGATRQEVLTVFQAVLALVRRQMIVAEQPALFAEIQVHQASQLATRSGAHRSSAPEM